MELSALLGEAYKDGMTLEEVTEALKGVEMPKDQSAEIERLKNAITKSNGEAADWRRKYQDTLDEDTKKAQQEEESRKALEQEVERLRKEMTVSGYKASYISMGYSDEDAGKIAGLMADGKMEDVLAMQKKHQEAMAEQIKKELLKKTGRPGGGNDDDGDDRDDNVRLAQEMAKSRAASAKQGADIISQYIAH